MTDPTTKSPSVPPQEAEQRTRGVLPAGARVWVDGGMQSEQTAQVPVDAHALHYGGSVFEGIRAYNGKVLFAREHAERLIHSAHSIGLTVPFSPDALIESFDQVLRANNLTDAYIRPLAYRGNNGGLGLKIAQHQCHVVVMAWHWPNPFRAESQGNALQVEVSSWRRFDPASFPTTSKCAAMYVVGSMAKDWALAQGADDALLLDYRGHVAELTGANVMFAHNGVLHTPIPDCFLDGITRRAVIRLAREHGIEVVERYIRVEELADFSEAFIVGTAAEVTPIGRIGGCQYNVGSMVSQLQQWYQQLVHA